jgi:hypothetical protein
VILPDDLAAFAARGQAAQAAADAEIDKAAAGKATEGRQHLIPGVSPAVYELPFDAVVRGVIFDVVRAEKLTKLQAKRALRRKGRR